MTGAPLTAAAFSSVLGRAGEGVVALSLLLFAFSSILGWSYYGQQAISFLLRREMRGTALGLYRVLFLGCTVLGAVWEGTAVWQLVDLCDALMALPNLAALLFLAPQGLRVLRAWRGGAAGRPPERKAKKKKKSY